MQWSRRSGGRASLPCLTDGLSAPCNFAGVFEDFMIDNPSFLRWLIAVVITVGITVAMVRVFHQRALDFNAVDDIEAEARKARIRAAEAAAEETGEEPPTERPLPPAMYNLSGRLLGLTATAFVFLLAFTFGNFWQNTKAANAATEAEAAAWTQAVLFADPIPADQGGDRIRQALIDYRDSVAQEQWPLLQRGDSEAAYGLQLGDGLMLTKTLLSADQAGASASPTWNDLTSAVSDMTEQGRYRIDALPGRAAPGAISVVFTLGISVLALTAIFQPSRLGANLAIMGIMAAIVATLLFVVVETSNPYVGSAAVSWPDPSELISTPR